MTQSESEQRPDYTTDIQISRILDAYLSELDAGTAVSREEFLQRHSDHAMLLRECLDGLDLMSGKRIETRLPSLFSDFEIRGELGRGGMGVVYEAHQKSLDRVVALKVMRFGAVDPKSLERFQREAETAAGLHHTNIVPVFANGREGDTSWYAMQRIDGESLAQRIETAYYSDDPSPVHVNEVVRVGIQVAEALEYAHKRGVIHRDVKPANLIVDQQDVVWLTDFGLARRIFDLGTTATGALMGTPRYMSPEQTDSTCQETTNQSDIYSLSATLYELAAGVSPFDGDDPLDVIAKIRNEDPIPLHLRRRDIAPDLDVVLQKAMAKNPAHRYRTAGEFAEDLRAVAEGRSIQARPLSWIERTIRWTRKHDHLLRPISIAVATTVAAVLLVLSLLSSSRDRAKGQFRIRAGGGPFAATIRSDNGDAAPLQLTVPMQNVQTASKGNYSMQLAPSGRWSRTFRFHVVGGESNDFSFRYVDGAIRERPIIDSQMVPASDFNAPAMLIFEDDTVRRLATDRNFDWEAKIGSVTASRIVLRSMAEHPSNDKIQLEDRDRSDLIDFRYSYSRYASWANQTLDGAPRTATPVRALSTPIDLDGDKRSDTVIASLGNSALLALDADGKQIWAKRYVFPSVAAGFPDKWAEKLVLPGVLDLHNIGDLDGDGVDDLVAQFIRIQPAVQNDICIAVLSGKNGELIRAIHCPSVKAANGSKWPAAGLLSVNHDERRRSPLTFSPRAIQVVFRRVSNPQSTVFYQANSMSTSFALPLPLQPHLASGHAYVIQCVGDDVSVIDLSTGEKIGESPTDVTPHDVPKIAQNRNDSFVVLLARNKNSDKDVLRIQELSGRERWTTVLEDINRTDNSTLKYAPSWPLVEDFNDDGVDEIIAPVHFDSYKGIGVQSFRLADGKPLWRQDVRQFTFIADEWIERIVVTPDVDDDGWLDIATVTIAGDARSTLVGEEVHNSAEAFVYVDWLSGATGEPLKWARHPISIDPNRLEVCEFDGVRSDLGNGDGGLVEVELVTGESRKEEHLDCTTIRFSPRNTQAIAVANGLTVCGSGARLPKRGPRWYRQRPGTFGMEEERLVLLNEPNTTPARLGESRVVATWGHADPLLAVEGEKPSRMSVVRANDLSTIWSTKAEPTNAQFQTLQVAEDRIDFIAPTKEAADSIRIMRLDGRNGTPVWSRPVNLKGHPIHAQYVGNQNADESVLVVDNSSKLKSISKDWCTLSLLHAKTGKLIWDRSILNSSYSPRSIADFAITDVNGDGISDICGADQDDKDGINKGLGMTMWDGRTGKKLWTRLWNYEASVSNFRPMPWCLLKVGSTQCIAFIEPTTLDGSISSTLTSIVVCNATDGTVLATFNTEYRMQPWIRFHGSRIADITTDPNNPRLVAWLPDEDASPHLISCDVSRSGIQLHKHFETECQELSAGWLFDVTGDDVPEAIATTGDILLCYSMSGELLWRAAIDERGDRIRHFSWRDAHESVRYGSIWMENISQGNHRAQPQLSMQWIDLRSGKVLHDVEIAESRTGGSSSSRQGPPVTVSTGNLHDNDQSDSICIAPSADGIFVAKNDEQVGTANKAVVDPRRVRRLPLVLLLPNGSSFAGMFGEQLKRLFVVAALLVTPVAYMYRVVRYARWSLRSFLLAPAVLMFSLVAWRTLLASNTTSELMAVLLNGSLLLVAIYGIGATLHSSRYGLVYVAVTTMVLVLCFVALMNQDKGLPIRFVVEWIDLVVLTMVMLLLAGNILAVFQAICRPTYRLTRKIVARRSTMPSAV